MLHGVAAYVLFCSKYCWADQTKDIKVRTYSTRGRRKMYLEITGHFKDSSLVRQVEQKSGS